MELPAGQDGVPTGQDGLAHRTIWTGKQDKMDLLTGLLEQYGLARRTVFGTALRLAYYYRGAGDGTTY